MRFPPGSLATARRVLVIGSPSFTEREELRRALPPGAEQFQPSGAAAHGDVSHVAGLAQAGRSFDAVVAFRPSVPTLVQGVSGEAVFAEGLARLVAPAGLAVIVGPPRPALLAKLTSVPRPVVAPDPVLWATRNPTIGCACNRGRR